MSHVEETATELRRQMTEMESAYIKARDYAKSEELKAAELNALVKIRAALYGKIEQPWEAIGRIKQILFDTYEHEQTILIYESKRKSINLMYPKT